MDLWKLSGPTPLPEQAAQAHLQVAFKYLQGGDSTTSLGILCQHSVSHTAWKCCLVLTGRPLCSSFCPLPFVLALGTTQKSLVPSSLYLPFRWVCIHCQVPPHLLFSRLNSPSFLSLSSQERCSSPLFIFVVFHWTLSSMLMFPLVLGSPVLDTLLQVWL